MLKQDDVRLVAALRSVTSPAQQLVAAITAGDIEALATLLVADPTLVHSRLDDNGRSMLHHATDWPGHFPRVDVTIQKLVEAGADPNVVFPHPHDRDVAETPLHWAASSNDVKAVAALLAAGAAVDALGGIFGGCTPFEEAIIFQQLDAARLLLDNGATNYLPGAAALGERAQVETFFDAAGTFDLEASRLPHWVELPAAEVVIDRAFQFACRSGHLDIAQFLLARGADPAAVSPAETTALDMATANHHADVIGWLNSLAPNTANNP